MSVRQDEQTFTGAHPTTREFVEQLTSWGFTRRRDDGVHTVFHGTGGGTARVVRWPARLARRGKGAVNHE
jgi:hypothetical protein